MNPDSASLQNLNDIVMPAEVAWWPLAPGWYVLVSVVLILLAYLVYRKLQQVKKNRYRVLALRELSELRQGAGTADWLQLPSLLKRAALSAWPRNDVAALSGEDWHRFLDRTASTDQFCSGAGPVLDSLAYREANYAAGDRRLDELIDAIEFWLKNHRNETSDA